jgi:hypothetical protein
MVSNINPLKAELNPICHLLVLLGAHHILHVSKIRVNKNAVVTYRNFKVMANATLTAQNKEEETAEETTNINCNLYYLANSPTKQCLHIRNRTI